MKGAEKTMEAYSLLIVDDEQEFVLTLTKRLQKRGVLCAGVFSGGEALARVASQAFDVVLLDMRLPDMNGNQVLREMKRMRPDMPVVILSGHASTTAGREGLRYGAHDYLMKPVDFESLYEKLQSAMEKASLVAVNE